MGKRGPTQQPAALAKRKGVYQPVRHEDQIANFGSLAISDIPTPPETLTGEGGKIWNRVIFDMVSVKGWLLKTDLLAFESFCEICAECARLKRKWKDTKFREVYKDDKGNMKPNPTYKFWLEMEKEKRGMYKEFGLTPSARTRIELEQTQEEVVDKYANFS